MAVEAFPLQLALPSGIEVLVVLLIIVMLFGANKIPKLARASGRALGEFQKGREELKDQLQGSEDDLDVESGIEAGEDGGSHGSGSE